MLLRPLRVLATLLFAALVPACGSSSGFPAGGANTAPVVSLRTPSGTRSEVVTIPYSLFDAESSVVAVQVEFSADNGTTWSPATPAQGCEPRVGLASSPGGSGHAFLWDSEIDGVSIGTVSLTTPLAGTINTQVRIRMTPSDATAGIAAATGSFTVDNTFERFVGVTTASFPYSAALLTQETAIGNLVADSMRLQTGVQIAFQNAGGIQSGLPSVFLPANPALRRPDAGYAAGPPFDLVAGDTAITTFFRDRVITRTVTGSQLWAALEHGVAAHPAPFAGFPQISGFSFTFSQSAPVGSKVVSVTLSGGAAIPKDGTLYTFATNEFLNGGGNGYSMLNDGQGTMRENQERMLSDLIRATTPITPAVTGRITALP